MTEVTRSEACIYAKHRDCQSPDCRCRCHEQQETPRHAHVPLTTDEQVARRDALARELDERINARRRGGRSSGE